MIITDKQTAKNERLSQKKIPKYSYAEGIYKEKQNLLSLQFRVNASEAITFTIYTNDMSTSQT